MSNGNFLDFLPEEFESSFQDLFHEPPYRSRQILEQVYKRRIFNWENMSVLPLPLRSRSADSYPLSLPRIKVKQVSMDGTVKYLFELADGICVESVCIPESKRFTVCFSTQAGCPVGCSFCATGRGGFRRQLSTAEIIGQILAIEADTGEKMTNAVAMGQGEPLLNREQVFRAFRIFHDRRCLGMSSRHLTLSTVGIIPGIKELADSRLPCKLAVSLHSARQEVRERLIPISRLHPLTELKKALRYYVDATKNRVTLEYLLLPGINDEKADVKALLDFRKGLPVFLNLIPWNPVSGLEFTEPPEKAVRLFAATLESNGFAVAIRKEKGGDIQAACGQLTQQLLHA